MTPLLLQGALLGLSSALAPGPFQAYLLGRALEGGARRALPLAGIPLVTDPPVIAVVLALLAQVPAGFLRALAVVGGLVVLWLAVATLRAVPRAGLGPAPGAGEPRGAVRAALVNLTNPNAWIFWSAVGGPVLAQAWRARPAHALAFLGGFYACLVGGNAAFVLVAGAAGRLDRRVAQGLAAVSGVALLAFGAWQLVRGLAGG